MVTQELLDFIKNATAQGMSGPDIKAQLLNSGWQEADIADAFQSIQAGTTSGAEVADTTRSWINKIPWTNPALIAGVIVVLLAALGAFAWYKASQNKGSGQGPQPLTNQTAPKHTTPPARQSGSGADEAYLAYKKYLFYTAKNADDMFTLAKKYLPSNVINQWNAQGGESVVFGQPAAICSALITMRRAGPEPTGIKIDKVDYNLDNTSATISATAATDKGTIYMDKEADGWKMQQESWPTYKQNLSAMQAGQEIITETQQCLANLQNLK